MAPTDPTPPDADDFLAENRANRAKARADAEAKAAKAKGKVTESDYPDAIDRAESDETASDEATDDSAADRVPRRLASTPKAVQSGLLGRRRVVVGLLSGLGIAVIVLAALAGFYGYRYYDARDQLAQAGPSSQFGKQAMDTARDYAAAIGTYDPDNYADLDRRIRGISTPSFADSYIASSQDARKGNANAKGTSKAVSKYAGLESLSATKAVVLVTLDQTVKVPDLSATEPDGIAYQSRVKITLKRDGDRWLISDLETV